MKKNSVIAMSLLFGSAIAYKIYDRKKKNEEIETSNKYVLLTGASTGIGKAIAEILAESDFKVFATVRKEEDAENLKKISDNILPVIMDVTNHESIVKAKENVKEALGNNHLYSIINNAGVAVGGAMERIPIDDLRKQFEVNLFGLMDTTQQFFDLLDNNHAKIINMGSIGGRIAQPLVGAYSASKHALEAVSDALRRELLMTNIDVIVVQPGMIATPIWDKAEEIDIEQYIGTKYEKISKNIKNIAVTGGKAGEKAEKVGKVVLNILKRKRNKSRYVVSKKPFSEVYLIRMLPDRALDFIMKKLLIENEKLLNIYIKKVKL
jgi:short-subunit dehydrogenase